MQYPEQSACGTVVRVLAGFYILPYRKRSFLYNKKMLPSKQTGEITKTPDTLKGAY